jgi:hypothetical protein
MMKIRSYTDPVKYIEDTRAGGHNHKAPDINGTSMVTQDFTAATGTQDVQDNTEPTDELTRDWKEGYIYPTGGGELIPA